MDPDSLTPDPDPAFQLSPDLDPDPGFRRPKTEGEKINKKFVNRRIFLDFIIFYVLYSTLLHLPPLRFHGVGRCWDRTQDCCDFGIGSQTL